MKIATAAYPLDPVRDWGSYRAKLERWVAEAAVVGADLLLFPEYGRMELAMLDGAEAAADLQTALHAAARHAGRADDLCAELAQRHGVHIVAPSGPVISNGVAVNRAGVFGPRGAFGHQDKQIMTRFERETWGIAPGGPLRLFDIGGLRIGILICYDAEFPALARAQIEAGAQILLIPSCTETRAGHARVALAAQARALEGQCVTVLSATVGAAPWCPAVDENVGAAAIFGPPDLGFPDDGVIARGALNARGWVMPEIDPAAIARVRRDGAVLNHADAPRSAERARQITAVKEIP